MLKTLDGSLISLLILFVLLLHSKGLAGNRQNRIFRAMLAFNAALIVIDLLTWYLDGKSGLLAYAAIRVFYVLLYALPVLPSFLFTMYIYDLIHINIFKLKGLMAYFYALMAANTAISLLSLHTGWYFSIDEANAYRRGGLVFLLVIFTLVPFVLSVIVLCKNRRLFKLDYFYTLLLYFLPQTAGMAIQYFFYGYTTNWIGMTLSLLIVYLNIQSLNLNTDYLTGVNNRRYLEETIADRLRRVSEKKTFAAIMIDIDDFKLINDNFGHDSGDAALRDTAQILKSSVRSEDYVARTGGDEFVVITDIRAGQAAGDIVRKIRENTDRFNRENSRPYTLSLSAGFTEYERGSGVGAQELLKTVDRLMYEDKKNKA